MRTSAVRAPAKTYADYSKLKEGEPCQLIDGMLVMSPSPNVAHQRIVLKLTRKLLPFADKGLGELLFAPMDVYFSETEVYQPDIIFISRERKAIIGDKKIEGAPDVIIEVLSPASRDFDINHKMKTYEAAGVREFWIVDPMNTSIEIYTNSLTGYSLTGKADKSGRVFSRILPDFALDGSDLFG
jgi:Uma2 family endonuclease